MIQILAMSTQYIDVDTRYCMKPARELVKTETSSVGVRCTDHARSPAFGTLWRPGGSASRRSVRLSLRGGLHPDRRRDLGGEADGDARKDWHAARDLADLLATATKSPRKDTTRPLCKHALSSGEITLTILSRQFVIWPGPSRNEANMCHGIASYVSELLGHRFY